MVVLLVGIGCGIGCAYFLRQGSAGIVLGDSVAGKTSLTEADLDKPMGSYNYAGSSYSITAREVIESSSSLDAAKKDDQTYKVPSADSVISVARNQIFSKICDAKNITVSDEEVSEFAQKMVGTSDFSTIASKYGIGEDSIKTQVTAAARLSKLRSETVKAKHRPVVIITSNAEKELPDAFLRRCVFHYIAFPDKELMADIVRVHYPDLDEKLLTQVLEAFYKIRQLPQIKKKPSTSEIIDWIQALQHGGVDVSRIGKEVPYLGVLLKKNEDMDALRRVWR